MEIRPRSLARGQQTGEIATAWPGRIFLEVVCCEHAASTQPHKYRRKKKEKKKKHIHNASMDPRTRRQRTIIHILCYYTRSKHGPSINLQIFVLYKNTHTHTHTHTRIHRQIHPNALSGVSMVKRIFNDILKAQNVPLRLFIVSIRPSIPPAFQM